MSVKISDERLKRVREILEWFKGDYDPVDDQENFEAMRDAMSAIDELLARRSVEVKPVDLPDILDSEAFCFDGIFQPLRYYRAVERAIKAAGGTVEGGQPE